MRLVLLMSIMVFVCSGLALAMDKAQCKAEYDQIDSEIKAANFCEVDSDCKVLELGGHLIEFGCYHFINKNTDKDGLYKKLNKHLENCLVMINDCERGPMPVCINKKCVEKNVSH